MYNSHGFCKTHEQQVYLIEDLSYITHYSFVFGEMKMFNHKHYVYGNKDIEIPAHINFGKYILDNLKWKTDEVALVNSDTDETLNCKDLTRYAVNLAVSLNHLGVGVGDTVAVGWEKRQEIIPTMLGVLLTGATYTCYAVNTGLTTLKHYLQIVKPKYLISSDLFWETYKDVLKDFHWIQTIIRIGDSEGCLFSIKSLYAVNDAINMDLFEPAKVQGQTDVAMVVYSSGTTGLQKGVQLTHLNCFLSIGRNGPEDQSSSKIVFVTGNWHFTYALFTAIHCIMQGQKAVYVDHITSFPRCIQKHKVDYAVVVPSYVGLLANSKEVYKLDLDSLKIILSGGSHLHVKTIETVRKRLPNLKWVIQVYGMTETWSVSNECYGTKGPKAGSVGVPAPGRILKVVDIKTREVLGPNQKGEICIAGPSVMKGYIGIDPSSYLDEDGFLRSGDIGYYDDDGYLFILDRLKDIIVLSCGINVAPIEIESILENHAGVNEAAVVGKEVPELGEEPAAFVVRQPGSTITEQELIDYVSREVPAYMQLTAGVKFLEILPRNDRGKILRRQLREMLNSS